MPSGSQGERVNRLEYLDFELEIGFGSGREYPVSVVRSPAGEARDRFIFPYDQLALESHLKDIQIGLLRSGNTRRLISSAQEQTVRQFGQTLFQTLLTAEVRSRYEISLNEAARRQKGLRIKLRIQPPELAILPWEFMYDPRSGDYICLSTQTPLVRYIDTPQVVEPLGIAPPLRILGVIANPAGLAQLDAENEKRRLETALGELLERGQVALNWLEHATWRKLQRTLRTNRWHILHFIGHGGFDAVSDEGYIVMEEDDHEPRRMPATQLSRLLVDHDTLRLVVLNACESAQGGFKDLISSTASVLVRRGLPAVLAMQYDITDVAAVEFARSFYEALADGLPVDAATTEARKAINLELTNSLEWGTPVLYLRAPDGVLFRPLTRKEVARLETERQAKAEAEQEEADWQRRRQAEREAAQREAEQRADQEKQDRLKAEQEAAEELAQARAAAEKAAAEKTARQNREALQAEADRFLDAEAAATALVQPQGTRARLGELARKYWVWLVVFGCLLGYGLVRAVSPPMVQPTEAPAAQLTAEQERRQATALAAMPTRTPTPFTFSLPDSQQAIRGDSMDVWGKGGLVEILYSPDGNYLYVGSTLGIQVLNAGDLSEVGFIRYQGGLASLALSPDGKMLAVGDDLYGINLLQVEDGTLLRRLEGHQNAVTSLAFSPDGYALASAAYDNTVRLWRVEDGSLLRLMEVHEITTASLAFSPDGQLLAGGNYDSNVLVWKVSDGTVVHSLPKHESAVFSLAFSPDGEILASGAALGAIRLWRVSDGALLRSLEGQSSISSLTFSPDGKALAATAGDGTTMLWRVEDGQPLFTITSGEVRIRELAFSPDGKTIAAGPYNGMVGIWDAVDGSLIQSAPGYDEFYEAVLSDDGRTLASNVGNLKIRLWRAAERTKLVDIEATVSTIWGMELSPDDNYLAISFTSGTIKVYQVSDGALLHSFEGDTDFRLFLPQLAFSPDSRLLAAGLTDSGVRVWRLSDGAEQFTTTQGEGVDSVAFSPDGNWLASSGQDNNINIWQVGEIDPQFNIEGQAGSLAGLAFSPDSQILAWGGVANTVDLFHLYDQDLSLKLEGHANYVHRVAFSPNGDVLASGSADGEIRIWRVSDGELLRVFDDHEALINDLVFSAQGDQLFSHSFDGTLRWWDVSDLR